ncbi:MAG: hypothetical protein KAI99_20930 [Cyclobacteriaceae bacterium]|nr:hypothetical protein [Cyclobacteriaceae bacterium]
MVQSQNWGKLKKWIVEVVKGGVWRYIGTPPETQEEDWAVLIKWKD